MQLVNAIQGTAGATVPFTPGSVATHQTDDRLTLYVMGKDSASSTPDTPTATNGWQLVKSYLDSTTDLFLYAFAIQAPHSSTPAPQIAFPGSTPSVTGWVMSSHRKTVGRYWKDPIGIDGNDGTTYSDYIFPRIAGGTQYSGNNTLPTTWFGGLTALFGVLAVPTDSSAGLDPFNTLIIASNIDNGTHHRVATQYAETSADGGFAVAWASRYGYSGDPLEDVNAAIGLSPTTPGVDGLVCAIVQREDVVAPPVAPAAVTGSASLSLSATNGLTGGAALALSATGEYADGKTWNTAKRFIPGAANTMAITDVTEFGTSRPFNHAWWKYTATADTSMTLNTFATVATDYSDADTVIQVYNQATEPSLGSYVGYGDDVSSGLDGHFGYLSQVTVDMFEGTTYHFLVGTYGSSFGAITTYALSAPPPPPDPGGTWTTLDLSLTEFLYNPATPGVPFGEWTGTRIQPTTFGANNIVFEHPAFRFQDLNVYGTYQVEITYGVGTVWTQGTLETRPVSGATSYWNDTTGREVGRFGGFNLTGYPRIVDTIGINVADYRNDWIIAQNAGHDALIFEFSSQVYITQIRVRQVASWPIASASATLNLSAGALYDAPAPPPAVSPLLLDMTPAFTMGVATKVGSGNVWNDGNDGTYFQLNGLGYFPENIGSLNAGYVLVPIPALPGLVSITSLMLNIRAEFYGIAGSPTMASLWVSIGEETAASPLIFNNQYAYLIPGHNYPVIPLGSIQDLHYELEDWDYATLGYNTGLDSPLAPATLTALRTGTAQLIISPRYHFNDSNVAHRIQGKFYEVNFTMAFEVGTPSTEEPTPGLPSGYTDWQELDLSTAIFYRSGPPNTSTVPATPTGYAFGRYDPAAHRILTNTPTGGWPDFSIPGFEMDPAKDYYFQFVFDPLDVRDGGSNYRDVYLWMANPDDPHRSYSEESYGTKVLYQSENEDGTSFHMFHLDPAANRYAAENWDVLANGFTLPIFEIRQGAVLAAIRYATREDGYLPPEPYSPPEKARATFWGQA